MVNEGFILNNFENRSPLIKGRDVTFIYSGDAGTVYVAGDYNRWELRDRMKKIPNTDLWYVRKRFPENSRFDYKYIVDGNWITDPFNETVTPGGAGNNSTLVMPGYRSEYESIIKKDIPHGTLISNQKYVSRYLDKEMRYHIYLPPGYEKSSTTNILYALDGSDYLNFSRINLVLDYLIHKSEMPPLAAVLADPHERTEEYTLFEPYYNYFVGELMPFVEEKYTNGAALDRTVTGVSWGGLTAIFLAVGTSGVFRRVLSQSGSFWPKDWLIFDLIKEAIPSKTRFCLQTGTIEDTEEMNDAMFSLLKEKGCEVEYMKYAESHSWGNWKGHLSEGLRCLFS